MSGHVYYRFKSQKDFQRIMFDGIGISVWDLKRDIIQESKMGKGTDFDFAIYNADTEEEYTNDHAIIPRSSSVIARRLPPKRAGHGNAQQYVNAGQGPSSSRTSAPLTAHADWRGGGAITKDFRKNTKIADLKIPQASAPVLTGGERDSEAESMAAMFAAQDQQWQKTQETMATATRVGRNMGFRDRGGGRMSNSAPRLREPASHTNGVIHAMVAQQPPPPQGYICYRCGQKGHWIQSCPTNDNPDFEGRPRIKRTTGIPKSFLQKVEGKLAEGQNVMVTADGSFVIAKPDDASWKQHKSVVVKNLSAADIENQRPSDPDLACSICSTLLKLAVKMVCCQSTFCQNCISGYLKDHSSVCPECETKVSMTASKAFVPDEERRTRSEDYVEELLKVSREARQEIPVTGQDHTNQSTEPAQATDMVSGSTNSSQVTAQPTESKGKEDKPEAPDTVKDCSAGASKAPPKIPDDDSQSSPLYSTNNTSPVLNPIPSFGRQAQDFDGRCSPIGIQDVSTMPMMNSMGMEVGVNGPLGHSQDGMMMNKGMESFMGAVGANHNVVLNSNQVAMYGNAIQPHGMSMEMMASGQERMLTVQMNQIMMMLQNGPLSEPVRMQLVMQHQQLRHQLTMLQRMGPSPVMDQMNMGLGNMNGMVMNGGNAVNYSHHASQNMNGCNSYGPHPPTLQSTMSNRFAFQSQPNHNSLPLNQHQPNLNHSSSPYQRLPVNNANIRRGYVNGASKRKRSEDLIELATGEKVPRYM